MVMVQNQKLEDLQAKIAEREGVSDFLMAIQGDLYQEIITNSVRQIEEKCRQLNYATSLITRLKMVCIEMLQNISKHGEKNGEAASYFIMGINPNGFNVSSGNCVNRASRNVIIDRLNMYKSLDMQQLKDLYKDSLKNTAVSEHGNASLGLLDMVYRANRQLEFNFHELNNDLFYFELNININTLTVNS